jgi:hypothetical protein
MDHEDRMSSPGGNGKIPIKNRVNELDRRAKDATKMLNDNKKEV